MKLQSTKSPGTASGLFQKYLLSHISKLVSLSCILTVVIHTQLNKNWKSTVGLENTASNLVIWQCDRVRTPVNGSFSAGCIGAQGSRSLRGFIRYQPLMKYITTGDSTHQQITKKNCFYWDSKLASQQKQQLQGKAQSFTTATTTSGGCTQSVHEKHQTASK